MATATPSTQVRDIDRVMAALTSPIRREILGLIWDRELPAGEIAAAFSVTKPTISQHLAVLKEAGLVTMTAVGTSRRYRAQQAALAGLHGALEGAGKWTPGDHVPERALAHAYTQPVVVASVEVEADQATTFRAFTDPAVYSRWLGAPVTIRNGRFAATLDWGVEVRGTYDLVVPPTLIVMRWDFEPDNVPVPGGEMTGYLRVTALASRRRRHPRTLVEVHQLVRRPEHVAYMERAWTSVLGRLRAGLVAG